MESKVYAPFLYYIRDICHVRDNMNAVSVQLMQ